MIVKKIQQSIVWILLLLLLAVNVRLARQFPVSAAGETLTIAAPVVFSGGYTISSAQFIDNANSAYFLDPAATDTSFTTAGNVGIGTTGPGGKLDIVGSGSAPNLRVTSSGWGDINNAMVIFDSGAGGDGKMVRIKNYGVRTDMTMFDVVNNAGTVFAIRGDGNVGIGTTSPGEKLEVYGNVKLSNATITSGVRALTPTGWGYSPNTYRVLQVGAASGNETVSIGYDPSANTNGSFTGDGREMLFRNGVQFVTPNAANTGWYNPVLTMKDGNVGIGTTAPGAKFDVVGNIKTLGSDIFAQSDNTNTAYGYAPIQIREAQYGATGAYLPPRLSFHWGGVVASQITIESDGKIAIRNNPGTGYENLKANAFIFGDGTTQTSAASSFSVNVVSTSCPGSCSCTTSCSSGKTRTGGGCSGAGGSRPFNASYPSGTNSWQCESGESYGCPNLVAYAVCSL